jgi:isoquinoline 1-oxidoreductase beta subunit
MEVSVEEGGIQIHRCVCAADVGQVVNPTGLEAQLIGGTIDAISTALRLEITIADGKVQQSNFHDYALMRIGEAPDVEAEIVASSDHPSGAGEMGVPTAAPALANAIYAASGKRFRRLPLLRESTTGIRPVALAQEQ